MFVYAEYEHSFDTVVVEHRRVRSSESASFEPSHANDFDRTKTYYVRSCRRDSRNCTYEGAKIIHMTGTLEEMATFKAKRPTRPAGIGGKDHEQEVQSTQRPLCKDREHIQEEERQQQIEDALNSYKLEHCPPNGASTDLQQRLLAVEKELETLRQEGRNGGALATVNNYPSSSNSSYASLEQKYRRLQTQFEDLKNDHEQLVKRFQDKSQAILEAGERTLEAQNSANDVQHRTPSPQGNGDASRMEGSVHNSAASDVELESAGSDNDDKPNRGGSLEGNAGNDVTTPKIGSVGENGKIYGGRDFWIDKAVWSDLFSAPTDSIFCRRAMSLFWTVDELRARSVTGVPSNRFPNNKYTRQPLTPEKLATLKGLFRHYVGNDVLVHKRMKAVRKHLSARLCDLRRNKPAVMTVS